MASQQTFKLPRFIHKLRTGQLVSIVAYGDSISEVGRTPRWYGGASTGDRNWAQQLGGILRRRYRDSSLLVHNFGIGGQNAYEALGRIDWLKPLSPDLVLIEFGANDCGWHPLPPECTEAAMATLIEWAREQTGADIAVLGLAGDNPRNSTMQHQDETRAVIRSVAQSAATPYIDLRTAMLIATDSGERWDEFHASAADCHPNDKGHRVWAEAVASALIEIEIDQEAFV